MFNSLCDNSLGLVVRKAARVVKGRGQVHSTYKLRRHQEAPCKTTPPQYTETNKTKQNMKTAYTVA